MGANISATGREASPRGFSARGRRAPALLGAVKKGAPDQAAALARHLSAAGINGWGDLTRAALYEFRDEVLGSVAASSAKTYFACLKAVLERWRDEFPALPKDFREILRAKDAKPLKTYLTPAELRRLESVETRTPAEKRALREFLVSAYTGMRISDASAAGPENIRGEFLTYTSVKTGIRATVPLRKGVREMIEELGRERPDVSLAGYNKAIRRLCRRAGIDAVVTVRRGGREETGPKWKYVSSHTGRVSFCTCLANAGAGIEEIRSMAGHASGRMTERYIVPSGIEVSEAAMNFFRGE